jgi:dihydroflavonol-4-reductase
VRVLVTGGTGFVGCHTAAALRRQGHAVRLLVRDPDRIERALGPLAVKGVEHVVGDVTESRSVERAVDGCDAVVHAAAIFTLDRRREQEVTDVNVGGTERVLDAAVAAGLDPIVHVSSVSALFPPDGGMLTPDERVKRPVDPYARSKAEAESAARRHQAAGAPVVTVYPGSIWGPFDPTRSDGIRVILNCVRAGVIPVTPGGIPMVDVRDLAALHVAALEPRRGPRRYMIGGSFMNNAALTDVVNEVTGRRIRKLRISGGMLRGYGRVADRVRRAVGLDLGITFEAAVTLTHGVPTDDSRAADELGVRCRPLEETLRDTLRWMFEAGLVSRRAVGRLAG